MEHEKDQLEVQGESAATDPEDTLDARMDVLIEYFHNDPVQPAPPTIEEVIDTQRAELAIQRENGSAMTKEEFTAWKAAKAAQKAAVQVGEHGGEMESTGDLDQDWENLVDYFIELELVQQVDSQPKPSEDPVEQQPETNEPFDDSQPSDEAANQPSGVQVAGFFSGGMVGGDAVLSRRTPLIYDQPAEENLDVSLCDASQPATSEQEPMLVRRDRYIRHCPNPQDGASVPRSKRVWKPTFPKGAVYVSPVTPPTAVRSAEDQAEDIRFWSR